MNNEEDEGPSAPPADEEDDGVRFGLMMMIVMIAMINDNDCDDCRHN